MIDIHTEYLLRVPTEAAKHIPGRPHVSTIWRWYRRGIRGIKLEIIRIGGRPYTSRQAIERFVERTTAAAEAPTVPCSSTRARARAISDAERDLARAGI